MINEQGPGALGVVVALTQTQPDTTVCTVTGAMNEDAIPALRDALTEARRDNNAHLVIDMSAVTFMNWAGFHTLLEARHWHNVDGGGHLTVVVPSNFHSISDVYIVVGLEASCDMYDDLAEALYACAGPDSGPRGLPRTHWGGNSAETDAMLSNTAPDDGPRHGVASVITTRESDRRTA